MAGLWHKLKCNSKELQLIGTLNGGQSFRWKKVEKEGETTWIGVFASKVWFLKQKDDHILYRFHGKAEASEPDIKKFKNDEEEHEKDLREYFQLDLNLEEYYSKWSEADPNFKAASQQFYGIRILKQDPTENIFSFICSSNNHISRISSMVEKLATYYGEEICTVEGETYSSFPDVKAMCVKGVEEKLRTNGFGYRAKYICKSAQVIHDKGAKKWLEHLKDLEYKDAKKELMTLTGVGAKVADCICLMSLGHLQAIPVDTHVYQIAARDYLPKLTKQKTVTEKIYNEIGDHFRKLYGPLAGWAHTVLFCADLKKFQSNEKASEVVKKKGKSAKR